MLRTCIEIPIILIPYIDLSACYASGKYSDLEAFIQSNVEKFQSDNNLGLVKQVLSSLYKRNIQRLTQTYLTLSLQDIANAVQLKTPKEAEMHVLRMIQDGEIFATINQKDGMTHLALVIFIHNFIALQVQYLNCRGHYDWI
ncbi:COP9 signalosome complex subunit 3 [Ananas comosus]|uniref:COP9 signalosome complex subunit 3 n=1 Tax=Ananas comosus TaxID=4615 RepID=A0A199UTI5_ANACO|nr:COP9 signalosome complex subunit 3 [Ananas comosus]